MTYSFITPQSKAMDSKLLKKVKKLSLTLLMETVDLKQRDLDRKNTLLTNRTCSQVDVDNSLTALVVTKLDVLSGLDKIKVCTSYEGEDGAVFETYPFHQTVLHHARGKYVELPGWSEDITDARSEDELPENARGYLRFMEEFIGVPIVLISVGPGREQTMWTAAGLETAPGRAIPAG